METLFTIPVGVFLVLMGLFWEPKPKTAKDVKAEQALLIPDSGETVSQDPKTLTQKQLRNYLRRLLMRYAILILGTIGILAAFIKGLGAFNDTSAFALLVALYGGAILVTQRAEKTRRLLVLFFMGFVGLMVWRTAEYREYIGENNWAILAAALLNLLFWVFIGRRFPPGTSDSIEVIGME